MNYQDQIDTGDELRRSPSPSASPPGAEAAGASGHQRAAPLGRRLPNNLPAAGYVTLVNSSDKPIDLTDVSSDDYQGAMLHQTVANGSTQQMVMVDKLTVPAHGQVAIAPGGYHVMLEHPQHKMAPGDTVHLKLQFSDGETLERRLPSNRRPRRTDA